MKRSAFTSRLPERREATQSTATARPRTPAAGGGVLALVLDMPDLQPEDGPTTAAGRRHMGKVAAVGCRLCVRLGYGPTAGEVHHIRTGQGGGQRASDFLTLCACPTCHRGPHGLHGDKSLLRLAGVTELDLLADTIAEVCP